MSATRLVTLAVVLGLTLTGASRARAEQPTEAGEASAIEKVPADAGIPTLVEGSVSHRGFQQSAALSLVPFSKLRVGDLIDVGEGARLQIVFFEGGRRETWSGPATLVVEASGSRKESGADPAVEEQDPDVGKRLQTLPVLMKRDQPGQTIVRGDNPETEFSFGSAVGVLVGSSGEGESTALSEEPVASGDKDKRKKRKKGTVAAADASAEALPAGWVPPNTPNPALTEVEQIEVSQAYSLYRTMRTATDDADILPEIYLVTTLRSYGLDVEAFDVMVEAHRRCSGCTLPFVPTP